VSFQRHIRYIQEPNKICCGNDTGDFEGLRLNRLSIVLGEKKIKGVSNDQF